MLDSTWNEQHVNKTYMSGLLVGGSIEPLYAQTAMTACGV